MASKCKVENMLIGVVRMRRYLEKHLPPQGVPGPEKCSVHISTVAYLSYSLEVFDLLLANTFTSAPLLLLDISYFEDLHYNNSIGFCFQRIV